MSLLLPSFLPRKPKKEMRQTRRPILSKAQSVQSGVFFQGAEYTTSQNSNLDSKKQNQKAFIQRPFALKEPEKRPGAFPGKSVPQSHEESKTDCTGWTHWPSPRRHHLRLAGRLAFTGHRSRRRPPPHRPEVHMCFRGACPSPALMLLLSRYRSP